MTKHEAVIREIAAEVQVLTSKHGSDDLYDQLKHAKELLFLRGIGGDYINYYADRVVHFLQFGEIA